MKNLYTCFGIIACFLIFNTAQSQVLLKEDFDGGDIPSGWNSVGFIPTSSNACDGESLRRHFHSPGSTNGTLESPEQTANGDDIEISFDYKIIDDDSGDATDGDFGTLELQYSIDGGSYETYYTIDSGNHTVSTSCKTQSNTLSASDVPAGSGIRWRINGTWNDGDYDVYIDNFSMIEQVGCIQPYDIEISDISTDEVTIDWTDLGSGYDSWDIVYVSSGLPPSFGTSINTTSHPYTLTGLDEGTAYDIYVTANCDDGGESVQVGPEAFKTIAIGADCEHALEVDALPYDHTGQDTEHYGNDYEGSAGAGCGADGSYLDGYDVVYHYVPSKDDILQIKLSNLSEEYTGIFVYTDCDDIGNPGAVCFGASTSGSNKDDHSIENLFVTAGEDYYIVVSSWPQVGGVESFEYDLHIEGFDCDSFETPDGDGEQDFIAGQDLSNLDVDPTIPGATLTWYSDAGLTTEIPETTALVDGTTYYVTQTIGDCESEALAVLADEFDCASELEITEAAAGPGACDSGTVDLEASANKDENIYWWDAETDGNILAIGPDFTTPNLDETTSYWVSEVFLGEGEVTGQANPGPQGISSISGQNGVTFTLMKKITLEDVEVFNVGPAGGLVVSLKGTPDDDAFPEVNESFSQSIMGGSSLFPMPATININYTLYPGTYTLKQTSDLNLVYEYNNIKFPYAIGTSGEVTDEDFGSYYYFYNWTILEERPICESDRVEVEAVVHPIIPIALSVSKDLVCIGDGVELQVDTDDDDYTFEATWDNGNESDTDFDSDNTITVYPTTNTTYKVIATDTVTGCETEEEIDVKVKETPGELTMAPSSAVTCAGESIELFAGGVGENFEDETDLDWTTEDNSSDSVAAWTLVQSPYGSAEITSNDNSQFYLSRSADLGAGEEGNPSEVDVSLVSSSFRLVSTRKAFISFYQQYRHHPSTQADVDVSIDGGATWENLISYTESRGKPDNFKQEKVSLEDYVGQEDVRIRFHYVGGWGWWWAIDNVIIGREYEGTVTWSPTTDLYLDAAATIAYDGETNAPSIYYSGTEQDEATYTATLTVPDCGDVSGSIDVISQFTEPPVADSEQSLVEGSEISDIEVTGENLNWYEDEDGHKRLSADKELEDGATYYVSQTVNGCESGVTSVLITLIPLNQDCAGPTDLEMEDVQADTAVLSWTEPDVENDEVEYYYYQLYETNTDVLVEEGKILVGTDGIWLDDLDPETDYDFTIYSICDSKQEIYSDPAATIDFTTKDMGVDTHEFDRFSYYPNPTEGRVTMTNAVPIKHIEVYDLRGRKILDKKVDNLNEVSFDLTDVAGGLYIAKVKAGKGMKTIRIVKK